MTIPSFDDKSTTYGAGTSASINKTAGGSNRLAIIQLTTSAAITGLSITYGGMACTFVTSQVFNTSQTLYLYYFINPPTGSTAVAASWTGTVNFQFGICTYKDANQGIPLGPSAKAAGSSTTPSVVVASAVGELVHDAVACLATPTPGAGQTGEYNQAYWWNDYGSHKDGAASVTMSWTQTTNPWGIIGVSIKPVVGLTQMVCY